MDDQFRCIYTSELSEKFGRDSITVETPIARVHYKPIPEKEIIYTDLINIRSQVIFELKKHFSHQYREVRERVKQDISDFYNDVQSHYGWNTQLERVSSRCADTAFICYYEKKGFGRILDRINPKLIIEVVGYCNEQMLVNELAKERNIPTIELQHGTIYENHAAYQYATDSGIKQFPDYMFTFSDFWNKRLKAPIPQDHIISVGYPHYEEEIAHYRKTVTRKDNRVTLLFISQGTIGEELSKLAMGLSKKLSPEQYRMVFKLHPSEVPVWKERYSGLKDTWIEVKGKNDENLYELFTVSAIQIGVYSTAVYEGLGFGLYTLIYKIGHFRDMHPLVEEGWAEYISDVDEALQHINGFAEKKEGLNDRDYSTFWKRDAFNNMVREINRIYDRL